MSYQVEHPNMIALKKMPCGASAIVFGKGQQPSIYNSTVTMYVTPHVGTAAVDMSKSLMLDEKWLAGADLRFPEPLQCLSTSGSLKLPSYVSCALLMASLVNGTAKSAFSPLMQACTISPHGSIWACSHSYSSARILQEALTSV